MRLQDQESELISWYEQSEQYQIDQAVFNDWQTLIYTKDEQLGVYLDQAFQDQANATVTRLNSFQDFKNWQLNNDVQMRMMAADTNSSLVNPRPPSVWKISGMAATVPLATGNTFFEGIMKDSPSDYFDLLQEISIIWRNNFDAILGPVNPAFVDAILSGQDIADGYRLEPNPNGVLWRVKAGRPHPDDLDKYFEQQRVIRGSNNRTMEEAKHLVNTSHVAQESSGAKSSESTGAIPPLIVGKGILLAAAGELDTDPFYGSQGEQETSETGVEINPYAEILRANGLPPDTRVIKVWAPSGHKELIYTLQDDYSAEQIEAIVAGSDEADSKHPFNNALHAMPGTTLASIKAEFKKYMQLAIDLQRQGDPDAMRYLGYAFHTAQDFYSHYAQGLIFGSWAGHAQGFINPVYIGGPDNPGTHPDFFRGAKIATLTAENIFIKGETEGTVDNELVDDIFKRSTILENIFGQSL